MRSLKWSKTQFRTAPKPLISSGIVIIGFSTAFTYMAFGKSGFYITMLFIVPKILATSVIIMLAVRESLRLSNIIYGYIFRETVQENMGKYIRLYCFKFIVLILLALITASADCGINYLFG